MNNPTSTFSLSEKRICFIHATWHSDLVNNLKNHFLERSATYQLSADQVDMVAVPGSLEIPLQAKLRLKTGRYDAVVVAGLVTDGGIYRHEFVAQAVLDSIMQLQMEFETPIVYAVLTPHHFHDHAAHEGFFAEHMKEKGVETAEALYKTLACCDEVSQLTAE
ncbi:6,7-dimethyl-8-ribityllumazine synthase [Leucothrix pacifica]|uniref:6,7-dimethyl-8-ribityllumazine synthase n=1 Tax=Leucothrix pacifica TaxID=1247513 RepID=A0A317CT34_9GAMM|nr:6,7-dimethyl-8-ribityllumazine synthase [Leucothrix pacifica]PWR00684.1 6,7-dimethyl-8-ribityllumazine synthase [Leucothrix pacifica]